MSTRYVVTFDRIGRSRPGDLTVDLDGNDFLAQAIHAEACKHLRSQDFDVTVDFANDQGWIESGRFGKFTFTTTHPAP